MVLSLTLCYGSMGLTEVVEYVREKELCSQFDVFFFVLTIKKYRLSCELTCDLICL